MSEAVTGYGGKGIPVRGNDIDTDRIIPARFMKCVTFIGLGRYAFNDERVDDAGDLKGHAFDDPRFQNHSVLVVNKNFGCGSSREHAPQALRDFGVRGLIGESFAEIFSGNCVALGIPAVSLSAEEIDALQNLIDEKPETEIVIDLDALSVTAGSFQWKATMPESNRKAFLDGSWDSTGVLLEAGDAIEQVASTLPYIR